MLSLLYMMYVMYLAVALKLKLKGERVNSFTFLILQKCKCNVMRFNSRFYSLFKMDVYISCRGGMFIMKKNDHYYNSDDSDSSNVTYETWTGYR